MRIGRYAEPGEHINKINTNMKTETKIYLAIVLASAAVLMGALFLVNHKVASTTPAQSFGELNRWTTAATNSSFVCGPTPTSNTVLSANSARQYAAIVNTSSTTVVYLSLGQSAAFKTGITLYPNGGSYEITPDNLFTGSVTCTAGASTTVSTTEK